MTRIALHVPVLGAAEATGPVEDQQLLLSATLSHVREAAGRSVSSFVAPCCPSTDITFLDQQLLLSAALSHVREAAGRLTRHTSSAPICP